MNSSIKKEIETTLSVLKKGGTIVYPTDTVWGIGCDASNFGAVKKIYKIKQRQKSKSMIVLVDSFQMLEQYVNRVPPIAFELINHSNKPLTIIYDTPINMAENIIASDNTLAIRVVQDKFCQDLIKHLKRPLVSTSANISGEPTPKSYSEISNDILKGVDYVVNLHRDKKSVKASSIIKLSNSGLVEIIRE